MTQDEGFADKVAAVFDERGWCILELEDKQGRVCAGGAAFIAGDVSVSPSKWTSETWSKWETSLAAQIFSEANRLTTKRYGIGMTTYNDNRATCVEDVVQIFREAEKSLIARRWREET
jgi:hypothetical protein